MAKAAALGVILEQEEIADHVEAEAGEGLSPRTQNSYEEAAAEVSDAADPHAAYTLYPMHSDDTGVRLGDVLLASSKISAAMRHCHTGIVFAVTLGEAVDERIASAQEENGSYGYVLDEVASRTVEYAAEQTRATLEEALPDGKTLTERYSPGYCDWPIQEQEKVFQLLPDNPAGIDLTESCLMSPRKSISGFMGIGPCGLVDRYGNACLYCSRTTCPHRRL